MIKDTVILYYPKVDFKPYYPFFWAPLSLLAIASPLVEKNIKVIILDGNLDQDKRDKKTIKENIERTICFGVSTMIGGNQLERGLKISSFVKHLNKDIPIVFGGPMATILPKILLDNKFIDFVVRGQGEKSFSELVEMLKNNNYNDKIKGVLSNDTRDKSECSVFLDKNNFPQYSWELIDVNNYIRSDRYIGKRVLNYTSSQGCPYRCGYCSEVSIYNSRWKAYTAKRTFTEIKDLFIKYKLDGIKFYDSNFFVNPSRVIDFSNFIISSGEKINWGASAHPKGIIRLEKEMDLIAKSGLKRLLIGAESGSEESLKKMCKDCTISEIIKSAEICAKHNIAATFTFIVGIPGLEKDDIKPSIKLAMRIKKICGDFDIKMHFYAPFPGTSLFDKAIELGYKSPKEIMEFSSHDYYLIQTPWIKKNKENEIRMFSDFYCNFIFPPSWFKKIIWSKIYYRFIYFILQKISYLRVLTGIYFFPIEFTWFKSITKQKSF